MIRDKIDNVEVGSFELKLMTADFLVNNGLLTDIQEELITKELLNDIFEFAKYNIPIQINDDSYDTVPESPNTLDEMSEEEQDIFNAGK